MLIGLAGDTPGAVIWLDQLFACPEVKLHTIKQVGAMVEVKVRSGNLKGCLAQVVCVDRKQGYVCKLMGDWAFAESKDG